LYEKSKGETDRGNQIERKRLEEREKNNKIEEGY